MDTMTIKSVLTIGTISLNPMEWSSCQSRATVMELMSLVIKFVIGHHLTMANMETMYGLGRVLVSMMRPPLRVVPSAWFAMWNNPIMV